jgi:hypothetical protein
MSYPVPCYCHRFDFVNRFAPSYLPWRLRRDWLYEFHEDGSVESQWDTASAEFRTKVLEDSRALWANWYLKDFHLGGPPCRALRDTLDLCRRERIPVALVLMPEGSEFQRWYQPADWKCIRQFLADLSCEYEAPIIDARDWIAEEDFLDSHHMLASGAAKFTDRLGREILPILLRNRHVVGR